MTATARPRAGPAQPPAVTVCDCGRGHHDSRDGRSRRWWGKGRLPATVTPRLSASLRVRIASYHRRAAAASRVHRRHRPTVSHWRPPRRHVMTPGRPSERLGPGLAARRGGLGASGCQYRPCASGLSRSRVTVSSPRPALESEHCHGPSPPPRHRAGRRAGPRHYGDGRLVTVMPAASRRHCVTAGDASGPRVSLLRRPGPSPDVPVTRDS